MEGRAIAYFSNGLGNFVMMMPALQALREMTGQPVDVLLPHGWRDSRRPAVEEIVRAWDVTGRVVNHPKDAVEEGLYSLWFWSSHNQTSDSLKMFKSRMTHLRVAKPNWITRKIHERDHYMEIVQAMGWKGGVPEVAFPLAEGPVIESLGRSAVIGLCNGAFSAPLWAKKHWPRFRELADTLRHYFDAHIVGVGGKGELDGVPCDEDFCGRLSITETAKVISQCDLFVATDTGNMHIADSMGVRTIALFGGTLLTKNAPLGRRSVALSSAIDCAPCQDTARFFICSVNECMRSIVVGDVMHGARRAIA
jgi:hypothetical protein